MVFEKCTRRSIEADFVVAGGGMAGLCAAISAARNGAKTVLLQDRSVLGGNASSEVKMHIVGADAHGSRPGTRESGIIEEIRLDDAFRNPHRSYSQWDLLLYEKVKAEPNITLFLDTACIGCEKNENGNIKSLTALRNSTEDLFEISAPFFADCTGDSRLALEAGADYQVGREQRDEFGESLALEKSDRKALGSSILITARRHETPQAFYAPPWIRKFTKTDLKHRPVHSYEYGYWWFEWGGQLDTIKDNEVIRHELLRIALGIWDYIKNSGDHPDSAHWALDWVGSIPGKRESRRLRGPHVLSQNDILGGELFEDAVAYGGWAIDLHPPEGIDLPDQPPITATRLDQLYSIPFRALYSRNIPNLCFAGRNISATHVAFASTRVMATCAIMGQAIGTAVALAKELGLTLPDFSSGTPLEALQQRLLRDDAFIPGLRNEDGADLAPSSTVSASSSQPDTGPELVVDGITRDLIGQFGPWADQKKHHWASSTLPAWIDLKLASPACLSEIHLTFDSGFQRELVLSASDHVTSKVVRAPQPELVRSYRIWGDDKIMLEVADNWQRKRIHRFALPQKISRLRLEVLSTHGISEARVFEIRAYS